MAKEIELEELNRIYSRAEEADKDLFAEMRSNLLLIAGEHYSKVNARAAALVRQTNRPGVAQEQKLRVTMNHMHKVNRLYKTALLAGAPGTAVFPKNERELQDKKDAELHQAVWVDSQEKTKYKERLPKWVDQLVGIGEMCVKAFWDPEAGELKGYEHKVDEQGQPVMEETGQMDPQTGQPQLAPVQDTEKPVFSGALVYEDVYGFNLLREVGTQGPNEHGRAWIVRKMVDLKDLKRTFASDADILAKLVEEKEETFVVFDAQKGQYEKRKDQTVVREYYWPKCGEYPDGWYVYATKTVKLAEGPLPFGLWPLVWRGFDEYPTSARGRSIFKIARPYQAEINRASSAMAVAQVTLGDDKILYQAGSKLAPGALLPGVRGIAYQGKEPTVLPGRNGAQYLEYIQSKVAEMYSVLLLDDEDEMTGQLDPYVLLFRAARQKKRFNPYIAKLEGFQRELTFLTLELLRHYLPDDQVIAAVGRREQINLAEYKAAALLNTEIKVDSQDDTLETAFGKQLTFQHILQYVGKDLDKRTIGKIIKNLPFANFKDDFDDMTIDEDVAENDMLALERGEPVQPVPYVDADFMLRKLSKRQKDPDFRFLAPPIQQAYQQLTQQYDQIMADQQAKIAAAKNEYIPVDGALIACDMYVPPANPQEQAKRAKIPQRALEWLLERLNSQGASLDKLEGMNAQNLADMATMLMNSKGQAQGQGQVPPGVKPGGGMPLQRPA